jgi:hypothetical protein
MPDQQTETLARPLAAALLIMLFGPLLGGFAVVGWNNILSLGWLVVGYAGTGSPYLDAYMLGGIQSTICAIIIGWRIQSEGWMGFPSWLLLTALVSLASTVIFYFTVTAGSQSDLFPHSFADDLGFFSVTTFFASVVLRAIIMSLGWMGKGLDR